MTEAAKPKKKLTELQRQKLRLARAYKAVLGSEENRSTNQQLVWEDMEKRGYLKTPVHNPQGVLDVNLGLINEGKRRFHIGTIGYIEKPFGFELDTEPETQE